MYIHSGSPPAIIDIEASGFGRGSYPIEIGVVLPDGECHCHLIRPVKDWTHWDDAAEKVHHITREMLVDRGRPVKEVASILNLILEGETVYSDAWGNDNSWLSLLFYYAEIPQNFRLDGLNHIMSEYQMSVWSDTRKIVESESGLERHRASSDAKVLQKTFLQTIKNNQS